MRLSAQISRGQAPNIVSAHTEAEYIVRGATVAEFEVMRERVLRRFQAGALATRTTFDLLPVTSPAPRCTTTLR